MNRILLFLAIVGISSCKLAPNRMFKTPKDYQFAKDTTTHTGPYIIQPEDKIELHIFTNDGFKLVDITQSTINEATSSESILYFIEENGECKMPVIGRVMLAHLSIKDAENFLQEKYSKYYKDPFVVVRVVSRRAYVFKSDIGTGMVIPIENDHTSLFEAIALAGGLSEYSKSYEIKIVRGDLHNPQIFFANIYSVEGLKNSELEVFPNDIIYIDLGSAFRKRLISDFVPYLSILSSVIVLLALFKS